jgi:tRNA (guanine37-N1)-methyltransferase
MIHGFLFGSTNSPQVMNFHIVTIFPNAFDSYLGESILKRAIEDKKIKVKFYNPRDFASARRSLAKEAKRAIRIDKKPFGGGPGMVIQAEPVIKAIAAAIKKIEHPQPPLKFRGGKRGLRAGGARKPKIKIVFFAPAGKQFDTSYAKTAAKKYTDIIFICGRYEGIDARIKKVFKMEDISVGPFVLTGGELPAMILMDSISRQVEGVLGDINSLEENRFASHDVYTRPEVFEYKGKKYRVPKVLLSGNHKKIDEWRAGKMGTKQD